MAVKPIPDGFHSVTPYLTVRGAGKMIEFLKKAFGAETVFEAMKRGCVLTTMVVVHDFCFDTLLYY